MKYRTTKSAAYFSMSKAELSAAVSLIRQGDYTMHPCSPHALSKRGKAAGAEVKVAFELALDDFRVKRRHA